MNENDSKAAFGLVATAGKALDRPLTIDVFRSMAR
jgi:hypothetical protein